MLYRSSLLLVLVFLFNSCKESPKKNTEIIDQGIASGNLDSFSIDVSQSIIYWQGTKPGGSHNGSIKFSEGKLYSSNKTLRDAELSVDMKSITNLDIQDPADKSKLENHLKSADFFSVDSFPVSHFKINTVSMINDTTSNAMVNGLITIKNITKPIQIKCKIDHTEDNILITVPEFKIDRTEFNVKFKSKKFMDAITDKFIGDEISLSIKIAATKG